MLRALTLSTLVLGAAALSAQLGPQATAPAPRTWHMQPTLFDATPASACPVQLRAQVQGEPTVSLAARDGRTNTPRQRMHLVLAPGKSGQVASVELTVEGLSNTPRLVQAFAAGAAPDRTHAFHIAFAPKSESENTADLPLEGFASVLTIRIDSITYADGRVMRIVPQASCRFTPDLLVPVATR